MIITRTPFRISFFGGGTDYPGWYDRYPGAVLATSIDKYCYITLAYLPPFFEVKYRINYSKAELVNKVAEIQHPSVRECLRFMGIRRGISLQHVGDLPARTGIGSSSSFTVGFLNGLYALLGKMVSKKQLAMEAINVEQRWIKENVGAQDQVTAAFGGLNKIDFEGCDKIEISPLTIDPKRTRLFERSLMLFFTGFSRLASQVAEEQVKSIPAKTAELKEMYAMVDVASEILSCGKSLNPFGKLLHESWRIKRTLSSRITTSRIDDIYQTARRHGALGGKLCGAGGGGFMLFFVKPEDQPRVKKALHGLIQVPFKFDELGTQVVYYRPDRNF